MLNSNSNNQDPAKNSDRTEEEILFNECYQNILRNINRNLDRRVEDKDLVSKLLSVRWFLTNEGSLATS